MLAWIGATRADVTRMQQLAGLDERAFDKADRAPDSLFYTQPRFVEHIDAGAIAAVQNLYAEVLPDGGAVLDLMSSWVSHFPEHKIFASVTGHGMNAAELAANGRLTDWFVQDLNANPALPLANAMFDAACICVSVQNLQRPVEVFREVARVLRPGAPFAISFSNRCFPTKAVAIWQALSGPDQQRLVAACMREAGFSAITLRQFVPSRGDPLRAVTGLCSPPV